MNDLQGFIAFPLDAPFSWEGDGFEVRSWFGPDVYVEGGTIFGCVHERTTVVQGEDTVSLAAGSWFVAPGQTRVRGGRGVAIRVPDYLGMRQTGGPIEAVGRLRYIDGCTDTLLVCPPRLGEPCLNHLHVPPGTDQSFHVHPSARVGTIVRGAGRCLTDAGARDLSPGLGWIIPTGTRHAFRTTSSSLDVLAWHPDSDFGPTDENHPMLNRTWRRD